MGSSLRRFSGNTSNMYKLLVCSFLAMAAAAPIEDTPEVAEAKATFNAAFTAAEAGEHIALRPVNNDVQAPQIASAYLDDAEEVAAAKAAFDDAAAGGLAAKQASAPVHVIPAPAPLVAAPAPAVAAAPVLATNPFNAGFPINGLGYPGIPYAGLGLGYNGLSFPYAGLPVVPAAAPAAEE